MTRHSDVGKSTRRNIALLPASLLDWLFAVGLFLLALGLALHYGWSKTELFWAVWTASLAVTAMLLLSAYLAFAIMGLRHAFRHRSGLSDWAFGIAVYLTAVAASLLPLGGIYWFTAGFVSSAILGESLAWFGPIEIIELLGTYWPIVLAGLLARVMDITDMLRAKGQDPDDQVDVLVDMMRVAAFSSAGFYLATFVFVFAVLFTHALELEPGWWLYTLVFAAFYILPARPLPQRAPDRAESMLDEQTLAELSALFREPTLNLHGREHRYPDYRSLYASPEFSRFAKALRLAGQEQRLKDVQTLLTQKVIDERRTARH